MKLTAEHGWVVLRDAIGVGGFALLVVGIGRFSTAAAMIVAGLMLLALAFVLARRT